VSTLSALGTLISVVTLSPVGRRDQPGFPRRSGMTPTGESLQSSVWAHALGRFWCGREQVLVRTWYVGSSWCGNAGNVASGGFSVRVLCQAKKENYLCPICLQILVGHVRGPIERNRGTT
jgi:hypothetical protein